MLKKQHKKSRNENMVERQQGRGMPGQSGPNPDSPDVPLRHHGTRGESPEAAPGEGERSDEEQSASERTRSGNQGGQPRSPRSQTRAASPDEDFEESKEPE